MSVTFEVELRVAASVFLCPRQFQPGVLHLQHKMAFVEFQQSLITHFTEFNGQSAALDSEIVGELLSGKRNRELAAAILDGLFR